MDWQAFLNHPVVAGAIAGAGGAALADYAAFRNWKSFDDALTYDWYVALFRWVQGAVGGALFALGWAAA
jgi:hypothetical protein